MGVPFQPSLVRVTDSDGNPINGAKMYFYLTGTTTNAVYYLDPDGDTAGPHPLVSDADGLFAPAYLSSSTVYRVKLTDATGAVTIWDVNNVRAFDPNQYGVNLIFETYADELEATGTTLGQGAAVFNDSGTHTDPVSMETVPNQGLYSWTADDEWQWVAQLGGLTDGPITFDMEALTLSDPLIDVAQEWNNAAVTFIGERRRITGTAYGVNSVSFSYELDGDRVYSRNAKGWVNIGGHSAGSTDSGIVVSRNLFDGSTDNAHGFVHADLIRRLGSMASASFDAFPTYEANSYDHDASFQSRPNFQLNGGSVVTNSYALYSQPTLDTGTITNRYGGYIAAPTLSNGGTITNQYGLYLADLTNAINSWAIYSAGASPSYLAGTLKVGPATVTSADPGILLARDIASTGSGNAHGFVDATKFRRSGTAAYASFDAFTAMQGESYDHWVGFQSRVLMLFGSGAQTITNLYGVFDLPQIDTGTAVQRDGVYIAAPLLTNGGAITTQHGLYVESLTNAGTNWAVYTAGSTPSYFGGAVSFATSAVLSKSQDDYTSISVTNASAGTAATASLRLYNDVAEQVLIAATSSTFLGNPDYGALTGFANALWFDTPFSFGGGIKYVARNGPHEFYSGDRSTKWLTINVDGRMRIGGTTDAFPSLSSVAVTGGFGLQLKPAAATNGQAMVWKQLTELTTIAAAATTDTTIQIPANVLVYAVPVRNTVAIPTAATYTLTGATSGTVFHTGASVAVAVNTTNKGNAAGAFYNATAQSVRITPNLTPGTNAGRVRVVIWYLDVTPPTS